MTDARNGTEPGLQADCVFFINKEIMEEKKGKNLVENIKKWWTEHDQSHFVKGCKSSVKMLYTLVTHIVTDKIWYKAAALTYSIMLAVVPILALLVSVGSGFGFGIQETLNRWVSMAFENNPEMAATIMKFVDNYIEYTHNGAFWGAGVVILLWAVIAMFKDVENQFNEVWNVAKNKDWITRITHYFTMFILVPVIVGVASSIDIKVDARMADAYSCLVYMLLFTLLYWITPNTKVKFVPALISGMVVGVLFKALLWVYLTGQVSLSQYNAVYGGFAAFPLMLFWMNISWMIILGGAELCFVIQNSKACMIGQMKDYSWKYRDSMMLIVLKIIVEGHSKGEPYCTNEIAKKTEQNVLLIGEAIGMLKDAGLVMEVYTKGKTQRWVPSRPAEDITIGFVYEKLGNKGANELDGHIKTHYGEVCDAWERLCSDMKAEADKVRIKDL